jgi:hypothetical protein
VTDIAQVIERMREIQRTLPRGDGVAYFNRLYLEVTEDVGREAAGTTFEDPAFLERLDVIFAGRYLDAVESDGAPPAWRPLFERRFARRVAPIQFALAGMNAHINFDLPVAVVATCAERGVEPRDGSPQHRDYDRINALLASVEDRAKEWLLTGFLRRLDRIFGHVDDVIANWSVDRARAAAWTQSKALWALRGEPELDAAYRDTLAHEVGFAGRGLLVPSIPGLQRVADRLRGV